MSQPARRVEEALIREGWETLVKKMGLAKATRFLVAFERGEGDSVKEIKRFWRGKSLHEIYQQIHSYAGPAGYGGSAFAGV